MKIKIDDALEWVQNSEDCDKRDIGELKWLKELGYKEIRYYWEKGHWIIPENEIGPEYEIFWTVSENTARVLEKKTDEMCEKKWWDLMKEMREKNEVNEKDEKGGMDINMNRKKEFRIKEVIELVGNCGYCTLDDYKDLFELKDCGFNNVRFVRDVFEDVGGCWIAEKDEYDVERDIHGGMFVKLSYRVERLLNGICENYE